MDKVVYILGAGFSAPLGLPVMSNFIEMSKDLYASDKIRFEHFGRVFNNIREKLAYITLFYKSNLDNIEEVLSILEMERLAGKVAKEETEDYINYIIDVIQQFTPPVTGFRGFEQTAKGRYKTTTPERTYAHILRSSMFDNEVSSNYAGFVLSLFNAEINASGIGDKKGDQYNEFEISCSVKENPTSIHSVITLNYDLVLENYANFISQNTLGRELNFIRPNGKVKEDIPCLAKLHGSTDTKVIVPPTWNKTVTSKIEKEWEMAYQLLSSANYIYIIGYSLPDSDAYVKYLLKSSILNSENLKRIDVLCLDHDGTVKQRYDSFITLSNSKYRFSTGDVKRYLSFVGNNRSLLDGHNSFFSHPANIG